MSSRSSRLPADVYAWYDNENSTSFDFLSQPSRPFTPTLNERVVIDPLLRSLEDRIFSLPTSSITRFPRPRMQLVVLGNSLANNANLRSRPTTRQDSELTLDEQNEAFKKLKKEIYNPTPKKMIRRISRFYSQNDAIKTSKTGKEVEEKDDDDDDSKCVICLEEFESKQIVMVTPCNHMFHEVCILPWVKSQGKCPVCRFSFCQRNGASGAPSTNTNNSISNGFTNELISFITSLDSSPTIDPFRF